MRILVTGGLGFIGSAVIRHLIQETNHFVFNLDKCTYAGNVESLLEVASNERYQFHRGDICDSQCVRLIFEKFRPTHVMHLAAETHVDRSIEGPLAFINTNVIGTYTLLEAARSYWYTLDNGEKAEFRFHHVSTDEVYGDLGHSDDLFSEGTPYAPSSPYSASKASSDHLVRAWARTYGLPVLVTNCSNNYGPYHFPEKLIPHIILSALYGKPLPVYGDGSQIRDWLYVEDHARALVQVASLGRVGETYNIGGHNEKRNIEVVEAICDLLQEAAPPGSYPAATLAAEMSINHYRELITFVADRPGHDLRYAIDASKIERELGWAPRETFYSGMRKTISWYLENPTWWRRVLNGAYRLDRLGTSV